ncbi:MAG: HAMP domain-containing histidine kinase [Lachnospiraceae bacterium]|nr:HAMP domain-containing histidine kinase [Lachnospiraceae bacterium]
MWIRKKEIVELSEGIRRAMEGQSFDPRDNREGALSILKNDIHTLIHLEQEQRCAAVEEKEHLAEYLSDISHQLKTPITSMLLMTELIAKAPEDKQKEFLLCMKKEVRHMEWLVTSLLKMAKLDSSVISFRTEKVRVQELLDAALKSIEVLLDIRNQRVVLRKDICVFCDRKWTVEALINLLKNASECSGEDSEIVVESGENPIYRWISVADAGEGLSKEQLSVLFRRYESSRKENGYGIGLPLALSIMRAQNGEIEVLPGGQGVGATFIMKFYK